MLPFFLESSDELPRRKVQLKNMVKLLKVKYLINNAIVETQLFAVKIIIV